MGWCAPSLRAPLRPVLFCPKRAEFQLAAVSLRVLRRDRDGLIYVLAVQDVEPSDPLSRLGERPVGDQHLPVLDPDRDGLADRAQGIPSDALPPAFDLG